MMSQRFRIITLLAHVLILSTDSLPIQVQSTTTSVSLGTLTLSPVALGTLNHFVNDDDNAVRVLQSSCDKEINGKGKGKNEYKNMNNGKWRGGIS